MDEEGANDQASAQALEVLQEELDFDDVVEAMTSLEIYGPGNPGPGEIVVGVGEVRRTDTSSWMNFCL